jgi:anti-sigma B factor antagonist
MSLSSNYQVSVVEIDGDRVVEIKGEIDLDARPELVKALSQASTAGQRLVVEMSGTTFMDSTGLKALLDAWQAHVAAGCEFVLRDPSPAVVRVLDIAAMSDAVPVDRTDGS